MFAKTTKTITLPSYSFVTIEIEPQADLNDLIFPEINFSQINPDKKDFCVFLKIPKIPLIVVRNFDRAYILW